MADHVDLVLAQWGERRPELDASPMAVMGRLQRLTRLVEAELRRTFAAHDLDMPTFDVLATLMRGSADYSLTPAELMRSSMVTSGAISQRLDRLEARGLVTRAPSEKDGRGVRVTLTEKGRKLIDGVLPDHVATEDRLLEALSGPEREKLADTLRTVLESLGDKTD